MIGTVNNNIETTERITQAAVRFGDNQILTGTRHSEILFDLFEKYPELYRTKEEGFLTSTGRFVDRKDAINIALKSGQIKKTPETGRLISEDLE